MPLDTITTVATATSTHTVEAPSQASHALPTPIHTEDSPSIISVIPGNIYDGSTSPPSSEDTTTTIPFNESACLFCPTESVDLAANLTHMSRSHALYVDQSNLLVPVSELLRYFHLVIHDFHECLYCGKQRQSLAAVRQHMIDKGHCKYDNLHEDSEFRDFYHHSSSIPQEQLMRRRALLEAESTTPSGTAARRTRERRRNTRHSTSEREGAGAGQLLPPPAAETTPDTTGNASSEAEESEESEESLRQLTVSKSTRAQKQDIMRDKQLARLRAEDRKSLAHLPASQQRALLATYLGQLSSGSRTAQMQRTRLETAGNHFNRLGSVRLIRQPPHFGGVSSLNR